jgi:hypothetical protein
MKLEWITYLVSKGYLTYILHLGMVTNYLGDLFFLWIQAKGQHAKKQILGVIDRREEGIETNSLQVCYSVPSFTTSIIPLLLVWKVKDEKIV